MTAESERSAGATIDDLEDLFENAPCGYLSADKDGRISRANATLARWIGAEPGSLTGKRFSDLLTIGGKLFYETHFAPLLRMQGAFSEVALDLACVDGRKLPVLVNAVERLDAAGEPRFIRISIFNASERRRYERELVEAKARAEAATRREQATAGLREQFIAVLGHDLRNPLASIAGGIRIIGKEPLSGRAREALGLMEGSIARAATLVDNVMDFARARLGGGLGLKLALQPLTPTVRQIVEEIRSIAPDRVVETTLAIDDPIAADHARLGQLISNLLSNAVNHGAPDQPIRLEARTRDGVLALSVANAGDPIPPEALAHLFDPFVRGSSTSIQPGLGLGLHIANEIARAHGGEIRVTSDRVETRFTFRMPLSSGTRT